jgi:phosphohistidine phosphatase SixA
MKVLGYVVMAVMSFYLSTAQADNQAFWQALKQGGKVVLIRHAAVDREFGSPFVLDESCLSERNLNDKGVQQAKTIGKLFIKHQVAVDEVWSSEHCRTKDTAANAFKDVQISKTLRLTRALPAEEAKHRLEQTRDWIGNYRAQNNLVLVSHRPNILELTGLNLQPAEMVALEPLGDGLFEVIATFKWDE